MDTPSNLEQRSVPLHNGPDSFPLKYVVICCTSVPDEKRTQLANYATQMGAIHRYDLTLDVTHLIVGEYNTPKYRYVAKERPDVQPMTTGWIEAMRKLWMSDEKIDVEAMEKEHTLPTLASLKFSMTGCDDPTDRLEIAEQVKANGGIYEGDLTKHITHLISFRTEGAKYKAAKSWGLRIVSIEWLRDSLERGMILDETLYDPSLPLDEQGKGAWDRTKPRRTSLRKRQREDSLASAEGLKRKLRRTASTKLNSQHEGIWGDIVGGGGSMQLQVARSGVWESADNQLNGDDNEAQNNIPADISSMRTELIPNPPTKEGIFSHCRFYLDGFDSKKSQILSTHLISNGADVSINISGLLASREDVSLRLFRIIQSSVLEEETFHQPEDSAKIETITEWWVERCLHHKTFFEPVDHIIGQPFPKFPVEEFREMTVSSAAFTGIDLLHMKKAVELMGAKYSEDLTPQSTVLLTKSAIGLRKDKADHAQEWDIPIVNATWLWDSITAGEKLPIRKYCFKPLKRAGSVPTEKSSSKQSHTAMRSKSDLTKKTDARSSDLKNPPRKSKLDTTAFISDEKPNNKDELDSRNLQIAVLDVSTTASSKAEPLSELNPNSPSRTVSTAPAPSDHPAPRHLDDFSNDISDLLSKTKTSAQPAQADEGRKRGVNRILGRATSNVSAASTPFSRASSVDSTATHGNPVEWPAHSNRSGKATSEQGTELNRLEELNNDRSLGNDIDSQVPASTQLEYHDPESEKYKERVMARMKGEKVDPCRKGLTKGKSTTLGGISEGLKSRVRRKAAPGFR